MQTGPHWPSSSSFLSRSRSRCRPKAALRPSLRKPVSGSSKARTKRRRGRKTFGALTGVIAIVPALLLPSVSRADSQATYLQCLTNFEAYAESIWHTATYSGAPADSGYWGDGGTTGNGGIRGNGGVAVAYPAVVIALPNDPRPTNRRARTRQSLHYHACHPRTRSNQSLTS